MKRSSWLDVIAEQVGATEALSARARELLARLDELLFDAWNLGDNVVLAWTREAGAARFLAVRHYSIIEAIDGARMNSVLAGPKHLPPDRFASLCEQLGKSARVTN